MIDEPRDAPQLEAIPFLEYETMRIETYSRQPNLMFHANVFRVKLCREVNLGPTLGFFNQCESRIGAKEDHDLQTALAG
jgi:hypothetical protein